MITQKGSPTPCRLRTSRRFPYPALYRALRKFESKHFEFCMNSGRAPCLVLGDHAENDLSQFSAHTLSSCSAPASRKPRPIQLEALAMPANNCLRLNEDQCPTPASPQPPQHHPQQFVSSSKSRPRMLPFENAKLLPRSKVFEEQVAARAKEASGHDRQKPQQAQHETSFARVHAKAGTQPTYSIRHQIAILASNKSGISSRKPSPNVSGPRLRKLALNGLLRRPGIYCCAGGKA